MDPYFDPVSGVLRNPLGITEAGELDRVEAALSASRLIDLERGRLPGSYDLDHLRAFHRYILWRCLRLGWGAAHRVDRQGVGVLPPQHLASYAADVFGRLAAADRLRGLNREQFIGKAAEFLADVNAMHPFREGNGRTQRAFFSQHAHDGEHPYRLGRMDPERNNAASAVARHGDLGPMTVMLADLIDRPHPPGAAGPGGGRAAWHTPCRLCSGSVRGGSYLPPQPGCTA